MAQTLLTAHSELFNTKDARTSCQLSVVEGPDRGRAVPLDGDDVTAGTAPDNALVLTDARVSGHHLRITREGTRFLVRDDGSRNGTFFEGSRITEIRVGPGAAFKLGHSVVRIEIVARALDVTPSQSRRFGELVAESLAMREVFAVLEMASESDVTVLVQGETGTGKELVARAVHEHSLRRGKPFVAVDCSALPENLVDSELFGHVRGAFTGAIQNRQGAFLRAHGGTLFLDELATIPANVQARLLRVLEERKVRPVGADDEKPVDVRVIGASREDLLQRVADGSFRADLYYRLSVLCVPLPPLRSRREDIPRIVTEMLTRRGVAPGPIRGPNLDVLMAHAWPGNVRELRNVVERALAFSPGARSFAELRIQVGLTPSVEDLSIRTELPFREAKDLVVEQFERRYLRDVLTRCAGNVSEAARQMDLDRKHLRTLLKKHGISDEAE